MEKIDRVIREIALGLRISEDATQHAELTKLCKALFVEDWLKSREGEVWKPEDSEIVLTAIKILREPN